MNKVTFASHCVCDLDLDSLILSLKRLRLLAEQDKLTKEIKRIEQQLRDNRFNHYLHTGKYINLPFE